jgi:hypothetical protein
VVLVAGALFAVAERERARRLAERGQFAA